MIKLSEFLDESEASEEAKKLGLVSLGWGRWGKDNKVTHMTKNGKLVPADQKVGEPHPSHGAAVRNVTRGRPAGEMPEPEYPIKYKQGAQPSTPTPQPAPAPDVSKLSSMVPSKPAGSFDWDSMDYTQSENAAEQLYQDLVSGKKIDTTGMSPEEQREVRSAESNFYNAKEDLDMALDDDMSDAMDRFVVAAMEYDDARSLAKTSPVGQPSTPEDPNAHLRATPLKKVSAGDYGSNEPLDAAATAFHRSARSHQPPSLHHNDTPDPEIQYNKDAETMARWPGQPGAVDPFSEDGYVQTVDALSDGLSSDKFATFIKPYLKNPAAAKSMFSKMIDQATDGEPDSDGYGTSSSQNNIIMGAGMALKVLRRLEDLRGPNVNSLSSMVPNRTPDQLKDPEDFAKNRQF